MEFNEEKRTKLNLLLFQLGEMVKDPPTVLDHYDWKNDLDYVMQEIRDISEEAYEKLYDIVLQVQRMGEEHIGDIDGDAAPNVTARSAELYFQQVAYLTSEINSLKKV